MTDIQQALAEALGMLSHYDYETNDLILRGTHRDAAAAILATEPMQAIALYAAIGYVVWDRAVQEHQPPRCKWHDHGPEMHIKDAQMRDAAFRTLDPEAPTDE